MKVTTSFFMRLGLLVGAFFFFSCSKSELIIGPGVMLERATALDPSLELVIATDEEDRVPCEKYCEGCKQGFRVKIKLLKAAIVQFEKESQAFDCAKKFNQWSYGNWMLDDVKGEPVLENFFLKAYAPVDPRLGPNPLVKVKKNSSSDHIKNSP